MDQVWRQLEDMATRFQHMEAMADSERRVFADFDKYCEYIQEAGTYLELIDAEMFALQTRKNLGVAVDEPGSLYFKRSMWYWYTVISWEGEPLPNPEFDLKDKDGWILISCSANSNLIAIRGTIGSQRSTEVKSPRVTLKLWQPRRYGNSQRSIVNRAVSCQRQKMSLAYYLMTLMRWKGPVWRARSITSGLKWIGFSPLIL